MKKRSSSWIKVYFDGSSLGNPGPAGGGVIFVDGSGKVKHRDLRYFGCHTNNESEYLALLFALDFARALGYNKLKLMTDSILLYSQLTGRFKVKAKNLKPFFEEVLRRLSEFQWEIEWIPREENKEADKLAFEAAKRGKIE
jgi:ribonuclease HI